MCCFSGSVEHVAETRIFARPIGDNQVLVYSMQLQTRFDVAMILPLPVPSGSGEDAVRFISLKECPDFFRDLSLVFRRWRTSELSRGAVAAAAGPTLSVHEVGEFEASFVPSVASFDRLDPRFRLPTELWENLPQYSDWGFAVFKLRTGAPATKMGEMHQVHPMAFIFPRRDRAQLFFPTVHIHDGQVHPSAPFDHEFYCQVEREHPVNQRKTNPGSRIDFPWWVSRAGRFDTSSWEKGDQGFGGQLPIAIEAGILDPNTPVYRWTQRGMLTNQDTIIKLKV